MEQTDFVIQRKNNVPYAYIYTRASIYLNKKTWILALIFNIIAGIEWTILGTPKWVILYVVGAMISIYFIMKGTGKKKHNEKEKQDKQQSK